MMYRLCRSVVTRGAECCCFFFFSSRRRHTRFDCDWSSDVCSSDLFSHANRFLLQAAAGTGHAEVVEKLLASGADVNAAAAIFDGRTALGAAAEGEIGRAS